MSDPRPVVLLPPSKGKAVGGAGPAYATTLRRRHPLSAPRRAVLAALTEAARTLDTRALARLSGVSATRAEEQRGPLADLADAPTLPAAVRYTGVVHANAGLADVDPADARVDVRIVSPVLGLVALREPVPSYRVEMAASLPGVGGLATHWRGAVGPHLAGLGRGVRVWDLLPAEHRRALPAEVLGGLDVVEVRFLRPDGRPANAARTKVAKGRLTAWLLVVGDVAPTSLARSVDLGAGWSVRATRTQLVATFDDHV